jgi:cytochrome c oxidase subunit 4
MTPHGPSPGTYMLVYLALMALLAATVAAAFVNFGPLNPAVAVAIAFVKAILVAAYFMHARYSPALIRLTAGSGLVWLGILFGLLLADYLSRDWLDGARQLSMAL